MPPFATLRRDRRNSALYADPADTAGDADHPALRFDRSPAAVIRAWDAVVRAAPRTRVIGSDTAAGSHHAVQRSAVFRFPDDIYAKAIPEGDGTRLLLYSASRYGKGDFGVNARRLAAWTEDLARALDGTG